MTAILYLYIFQGMGGSRKLQDVADGVLVVGNRQDVAWFAFFCLYRKHIAFYHVLLRIRQGELDVVVRVGIKPENRNSVGTFHGIIAQLPVGRGGASFYGICYPAGLVRVENNQCTQRRKAKRIHNDFWRIKSNISGIQ